MKCFTKILLLWNIGQINEFNLNDENIITILWSWNITSKLTMFITKIELQICSVIGDDLLWTLTDFISLVSVNDKIYVELGVVYIHPER